MGAGRRRVIDVSGTGDLRQLLDRTPIGRASAKLVRPGAPHGLAETPHDLRDADRADFCKAQSGRNHAERFPPESRAGIASPLRFS
jgi:hypothetical protein